MNSLLTLHLVAVGIWIGVVAAETVIELDGKKDESSHFSASKLHFMTDIWIEIPAFTIVFITGVLMMTKAHFSGLFLAKVIFGLIAIVANLICVYGVFVRNRYATNRDIYGVRSVEPILVRGGVGFVPSFIAAISIAMYLAFL